MAAETSIDAKVPVMLALFKLGVFYGADVFNKEVSCERGSHASAGKVDRRLDRQYQRPGPNGNQRQPGRGQRGHGKDRPEWYHRQTHPRSLRLSQPAG